MLRNSSGMALLITLAAISFLIALTVQLATSVNWQVHASANQKDAVRLNAALYSGLSLVRASLYGDQQPVEQGNQQQQGFDSLQDGWNTLDKEKMRELVGGDGLSLTVQDLTGRIQLNRLVLSAEEKQEILEQQLEQQRQDQQEGRQPRQLQDPEKEQQALWKRFLLSGKFAVENEDEAIALIDALSDWIDADDEELDHGVENGYYQSLETPYSCRNGPLQYPEELLLVKGFTRKLVYGDEEHQGILQYLTIYGDDGKININTAPAPVLKALAAGITDEMVDLLIEFRTDQENLDALADPGWYQQVNDFPDDIVIDEGMTTTKSSFFSCTITAGRDGLQQTGQGFIYRDPNTQEQTLLSWRVE